MKRKSLLLLLILCFLLSGCAVSPGQAPAPAPETEASAPPLSFTDDLGRELTISPPERVAALLGSFAEVWTLAGGTVCAAADDAWEDFDLALPEDAVNLGGTKELSLERLLAARPDLVLASTNTRQHMEWRETLERAGIAVAYFDVADFEDYLRLLAVCTALTGQPERYERYGSAVAEQIEGVLSRSRERLAREEAPTVLSLRASAGSIRAKNSRDNVLGELLAALGCVNVADTDASLLENLSLEHILLADPDYIFLVQQGDDTEGTERNIRQLLTDNPAWAGLSAVKNGRVYFLEKSLYGVKPNARWGEAYERVEEILEHG